MKALILAVFLATIVQCIKKDLKKGLILNFAEIFLSGISNE